MDVRVGLWRRLSGEELMLLNCGVGEDSWEFLGLQHTRLPCPSQLPEFTQTQVHQVSDAIQPFHPLLSLSPSIFPSISLFQWVSSLHQVAKVLGVSASASVLPMNIQDWFPLGLTGLISLQSKRLSSIFSNTTVQKHQFFASGKDSVDRLMC